MLRVLTSTQMTHFSISKGLWMGGKKRGGVKQEGSQQWSQSRESKAGYRSWRISLPLWGNALLSSVFPSLCCSLHGNWASAAALPTCVAPAGLFSSVVYIPCEWAAGCEQQPPPPPLAPNHPDCLCHPAPHPAPQLPSISSSLDAW